VTVRAGSAPISGWTATLGLASGQAVSQVWNGTLSGSAPTITVRNLNWNGTFAAGAGTAFGFLGSGPATAPTLTCKSP
jgi:cellulase/cellobiase CelA1